MSVLLIKLLALYKEGSYTDYHGSFCLIFTQVRHILTVPRGILHRLLKQALSKAVFMVVRYNRSNGFRVSVSTSRIGLTSLFRHNNTPLNASLTELEADSVWGAETKVTTTYGDIYYSKMFGGALVRMRITGTTAPAAGAALENAIPDGFLPAATVKGIGYDNQGKSRYFILYRTRRVAVEDSTSIGWQGVFVYAG